MIYAPLAIWFTGIIICIVTGHAEYFGPALMISAAILENAWNKRHAS